MHQAGFAGASMAGVSNKKATVKILVVLHLHFMTMNDIQLLFNAVHDAVNAIDRYEASGFAPIFNHYYKAGLCPMHCC